MDILVGNTGFVGSNIKKNFIYDLIHLVPSMLKADKYDELRDKEPLIGECYTDQDKFRCGKIY